MPLILEMTLGRSGVAIFTKFKHKLAAFYDKFGGYFCKSILVAGLLLYLIFVLSSHPYCQSQFLAPFFNQHAKNSHTSKNQISCIYSNPTKLNHIVFGIASSAESWRHRGAYVDLWWRPNKTRGFVWLDRAPDYPWPSSSPPFRISESVERFHDYAKHAMPFTIRMARAVLESFRLGLDDIRWFVMGDDDTVFFVDNLVETLVKYDHNGYYYVGGNSECVSQNTAHSFEMAFGGGGWAVSFPVAKALYGILDECLKRYQTLYGSDHVIQSCIAEIGVSLTREQGFHQLDLKGDISGLLSAHPQSPFVSLHHVDFVAPIFPSMDHVQSLKLLMNASQADHSRLLQQTVCYDKRNNWSISVSWGYSVQIYEKIIAPGFLHRPLQTFHPWKNTARPPFMFNTRLPSNDPCEAPHWFFFESVKIIGDRISTSYVRRWARQLQACSNGGKYSPDTIDRVTVVTTRSKKVKWGGGRRECCEVAPFSGMNVTQVRLMACTEGEVMAIP